MPAGLQVFNDSMSMQIDENYINMVLLNKGTTTLSYQIPFNQTPNIGPQGVWKASINTSVDATTGQANDKLGLIAFRGRDGAHIGISSGNGFNSCEFFGYRPGAAPVVDWWAFGQPSDDSSSPFMVWNQFNQVVFNANQRGMDVKKAVFDPFTGYPNTMSVSDVAGDYALIVGNPLGSINNSGAFGGIQNDGSGGYVANEAKPCWAFNGSQTGFSGLWKPVVRRQFYQYPIQSGGGQALMMINVSGL